MQKLSLFIIFAFTASMLTGAAGPFPYSYTYPYFQGFDTDGAPVANGFLYTYEAGTSNLKAAYTNIDCSTAHDNPIELDANGKALSHFTHS